MTTSHTRGARAWEHVPASAQRCERWLADASIAGRPALLVLTVRRFICDQAGREAPGRVYRCWSAGEHDRLAARTEPEIAVADLTDFALQLASWATPTATGPHCRTRHRRRR